MPYSSPEGKDVARNWYREINPSVVVDVGPGYGTYSKLLRRKDVETWIGIEAWAPYINEFRLHRRYDHLIVADVRYVDLELVSRMTMQGMSPDLVIMGDVLEHLIPLDAIAVIRRMKDWAGNIIVSLPIIHWEQGAHEGNWFETHEHHWDYNDMREVLAEGSGSVDGYKGKTLGYYWWRH